MKNSKNSSWICHEPSISTGCYYSDSTCLALFPPADGALSLRCCWGSDEWAKGLCWGVGSCGMRGVLTGRAIIYWTGKLLKGFQQQSFNLKGRPEWDRVRGSKIETQRVNWGTKIKAKWCFLLGGRVRFVTKSGLSFFPLYSGCHLKEPPPSSCLEATHLRPCCWFSCWNPVRCVHSSRELGDHRVSLGPPHRFTSNWKLYWRKEVRPLKYADYIRPMESCWLGRWLHRYGTRRRHILAGGRKPQGLLTDPRPLWANGECGLEPRETLFTDRKRSSGVYRWHLELEWP